MSFLKSLLEGFSNETPGLAKSYRVYFNNNLLFLGDKIKKTKEFDIIHAYDGNPALLLRLIQDLESQKPGKKHIAILYHDADRLYKDFISLTKIISAAGGLVLNEDKELLCIFRRGHWDLPKGKIDSGESSEDAAIREVEEETGVKNLKLGKFSGYTYHLYRDREERLVLKLTYWYKMTTHSQYLVPQTEEDIEKAEWMDPKVVLSKRAIYKNIADIIKANFK